MRSLLRDACWPSHQNLKLVLKHQQFLTHCNKGCIIFFPRHIIGSHPRTHTRAATVVHHHTPPSHHTTHTRVMKRSFCRASDMNPNSVLGALLTRTPPTPSHAVLQLLPPTPHTRRHSAAPTPALSPRRPRPTASGINALKYHRRLKMLLQ